MYKRPIYYLQRTWYIGRPSTTYLVYWSIGHPVLAHMSDNRLVQETYNWGVGTLTVIFRGKNRYLKKMQQRTTLIRISDLLKEYLCAFGKYQKKHLL